MPLMRTYTHAALSYVIALRLSDSRDAAWASTGASLPDVPALAGSAWLLLKDRRLSRDAFYGEVCGRRRFGLPDAALHSVATLAAAGAALLVWRRAGYSAPVGSRGAWFLIGWAGHVATDFLTHGSDARQPLWPVSRWRFESPISYRERDRHGVAFTVVEHASFLILLYELLRRREEIQEVRRK